MPDLKLVSVYNYVDIGNFLYELLTERTPDESISHKKMPSYDGHVDFIHSCPYFAWYIITLGGIPIGSVYLSKQREIGVSVFNSYRGKGYGIGAIKKLIELHPGKFLANINPRNEKSIALFNKFGFNHIQNTYAHE